MKVYVVEILWYDEQDLVGIYSTKERAKEVASGIDPFQIRPNACDCHAEVHTSEVELDVTQELRIEG